MIPLSFRQPSARPLPFRRSGGAVRTAVHWAAPLLTVPLLAALLLALAGCQGEKEDTGSEGTVAAPAPITLGATWSGTVGKAPSSSYYAVTSIPAGAATRVITLTNLTDDADLAVFTDTGFSVKYCSNAAGGAATESCGPPSPVDSTALYIQVKSFSATGTTYLLTVN